MEVDQIFNMHYLEITLFVEPRKSVGHFLNAAAVVYSLSLCPTEARCGGEDVLR